MTDLHERSYRAAAHFVQLVRERHALATRTSLLLSSIAMNLPGALPLPGVGAERATRDRQAPAAEELAELRLFYVSCRPTSHCLPRMRQRCSDSFLGRESFR